MIAQHHKDYDDKEDGEKRDKNKEDVSAVNFFPYHRSIGFLDSREVFRNLERPDLRIVEEGIVEGHLSVAERARDVLIHYTYCHTI